MAGVWGAIYDLPANGDASLLLTIYTDSSIESACRDIVIDMDARILEPDRKARQAGADWLTEMLKKIKKPEAPATPKPIP